MAITDSMGKTLGDPGPSREGCAGRHRPRLTKRHSLLDEMIIRWQRKSAVAIYTPQCVRTHNAVNIWLQGSCDVEG